MTSKKVLTQVKKAVQLIYKERWDKLAAIEAAHTSVADDVSFEEFEVLVDRELGGDNYVA